MLKIAYFLTHPTQNQAPFIRELLAQGLDVTTVFAGAAGDQGYYDTDFKKNVAWDVPLLSGYQHEVMEWSPAALPPERGHVWYFRRLWVWLQENRPDVVLLHGWSHVYCRVVWTVANLLRIPLVLRGETSAESVRGSVFRQSLHRFFYAWRFRSVRGFISIGTLNERLYLDYGVNAQRVCMLPYCVDDAFFATRAARARPAREKLRERLGIAAGRAVLLFCGKLIEEKGLVTLVQAMGHVAAGQRTAPVLLMAGDGLLRSKLEAQVQAQCPDCVRFLGFYNQTELPALYELCDLFVLPSIFEPWGLVVNEAMAAGRPVIVSDRVGCRADLVQDGVNGSVFHAGNVESLAQKITLWLADPAAREMAGARSREILATWRKRFDVGTLQTFFRDVVITAGGCMPKSDKAQTAPVVSKRKTRIAFVFTHQIQYFTNLLDELHSRGEVELRCFYARETARMMDAGFNRTISWDNRLSAAFPTQVLVAGPLWQRIYPESTLRAGLFDALDDFAPDIVHLNGYANVIQWQAWAWARLCGATLLLRGDGDMIHGTQGRVTRLLTRLFVRGVDHVFYQGQENRAYWLARGAEAEKLSWVPCVPDNAIYGATAFADETARQAFRAETRTNSDETVFIVSGKLEQRKRPQDAIEVLALLPDVPCKVWFLGSGKMEDGLKRRARELGVANRVYFWGFRNQSELPRILSAADVLLHPSQRDPWPYSVLEGAMCGLALLLSNKTGSYPDLVSEAGAGRTFECANLNDMAAHMRALTLDPQSRAAFRAKAVATSRNYTETRFCEILEGTVSRLT